MAEIGSLIFTAILAFFQAAIAPKMAIFGAAPNLAISGIFGLFFSGNWRSVFLSALLAGIIYGWGDLHFWIYPTAFILTSVVFWFFGKHYVLNKKFFSAIAFGFLGTIFFNFVFLSLGYLFFRDDYYGYFFSWHHLLEAIFNALLAGVFSVFCSFVFKNNRFSNGQK